MFNGFSSKCLALFVNYTSIREIEIPKTFVGVIHRILQFILLAYIFIYVVWTRKGYQQFQAPRGSSVIKVKGVGRVIIVSSTMSMPEDLRQSLWDASEYGIPPLEENAFFIATRKTVTYDQKQSVCPSALTDKLFCNSTEKKCKQDTPTSNTFGFLTGKCVPSLEDMTKNVCEISAWCPEELSYSIDYQITIDDLQNFTVFIKTIVSFTDFKIKLRTVKDDTNFLCRFDSDTDRRCPIFRIGYILRKLQEQDSTINLTALYSQGGLIEIQQDWRCNFDFDKERKECFPSYTFKLLQSGDDPLSPGINYRFADKYRTNGIEYRTLTKMYGLRFVLTITGDGRKFDFYYLFLGVGSGIGCLVIADLVCEFIFLYVHKNSVQFRQNKITMCDLVEAVNTESTKL